MDQQAIDLIAFQYRQTHDRVLTLIDDMTEEQLNWRPTPLGRSVAWNLWHLARRGDELRVRLPSWATTIKSSLDPERHELELDEITARLQSAMDDQNASIDGTRTTGLVPDTLTLPAKPVLLRYARRVFAATERAVAIVEVSQVFEPTGERSQTRQAAVELTGDLILTHLMILNRYLGEIECLRGLQGLSGAEKR
jgi:hypothetical protein